MPGTGLGTEQVLKVYACSITQELAAGRHDPIPGPAPSVPKSLDPATQPTTTLSIILIHPYPSWVLRFRIC